VVWLLCLQTQYDGAALENEGVLHMLPSDFSFTPASDPYNPLMFHTLLIKYIIHQIRKDCELQQKNMNNFFLVAWLVKCPLFTLKDKDPFMKST
jgi:hypothetical protein